MKDLFLAASLAFAFGIINTAIPAIADEPLTITQQEKEFAKWSPGFIICPCKTIFFRAIFYHWTSLRKFNKAFRKDAVLKL